MRKNEPYNKIRELRLRNNMSQRDLCRKAGIDHSTLSQLETSGRQPSVTVCEKLANAFGVTAGEVRGYDHPYNRSDIILPKDNEDYLCVVKTMRSRPEFVRVLTFNTKNNTWMIPDGGGTIEAHYVKWWADIPRPPAT